MSFEVKPALVVSILLITITWWILKLWRRRTLLPPGPWGLPLLGNLPFLDPDLHRGFAQLSLKYGPILKLHLGSKLAIVLSSPEVAKEILKDHDVTFAHRDITAVIYVGTYGASDMAFSPYGAQWRMLRKVCVQELLSHGRLDALYGLRRREVRNMVTRVHSKIGTSVNIGEEVLLAMFNMITGMMWGNTLDGEERLRFTSMFQEVIHKMIGLAGAANISDLFPVLERFDLQGKVRDMKAIIKRFDQIFDSVIAKRRKIQSQEENDGSQRKEKDNKDFLEVLLQLIDKKDQKTPLTETHLKGLFVDMTTAGTKTTSATVEWAMAELLNHPNIIKKIQKELENVVGLNKVVEETDLPKLKYLDAVIKEVFRLHPISPLLIPRCPVESSTIGGYLIPKGAKVFVNVWAIQRDPEYWNHPLEFLPERFLESGKVWDYSGNDFRFLPFGSGRRICAGVSVAERSVLFLLASLLHSFDWELPAGVVLDLSEQFGIELTKKIPLFAVPSARLSDSVIYS